MIVMITLWFIYGFIHFYRKNCIALILFQKYISNAIFEFEPFLQPIRLRQGCIINFNTYFP